MYVKERACFRVNVKGAAEGEMLSSRNRSMARTCASHSVSEKDLTPTRVGFSCRELLTKQMILFLEWLRRL